MQIRELVQVARYLSEIFQSTNLPGLYQRLIDAINQAAQNQRPNQVQAVLTEIRSAHEQAQEAVLSPAQTKLLVEYGANKLLGAAALKRIEQILSKHQAHPQGLVTGFKKLLDETNSLNSKAAQLITVLEPMFPTLEDPESDLAEDEGRLWLHFTDGVAVKTITDLESAAETWKQVLHNFSRLPNATYDGARILHIQKRSPLQLELAANIVLLTPLALGITWVLNRVEHVIKIRQEAEKLKQLEVKTDIIEALKVEAESQRKKIAEEGADEVQKQFGGNNEARNAVQQALAKIIKFIEGGGELDIDLAAEEEDVESEDGTPKGDDERKNIRALIRSIRQEMKALPPPPSEEADDDESEG